MGIEIVVEDESGKQIASVEDPKNILHRILPSQDDPSYKCLNRVDWYGDTTFNRYQVPDVRAELNRLVSVVTTSEERKLIHQIDELAAQSQLEPHLYLKFYGD